MVGGNSFCRDTSKWAHVAGLWGAQCGIQKWCPPQNNLVMILVTADSECDSQAVLITQFLHLLHTALVWGETNQNLKWLSDWRWQDEFIETSVFRRFLSKSSEEFSLLNCSSCHSARSLVSSGSLYASPRIFLRGVVFIPVIYGWESTHCLISDGPYCIKQAYPLKTGGSLNGTGGNSLIGDWLPLFLETICLLENFKGWAERCLAGACFGVPGS